MSEYLCWKNTGWAVCSIYGSFIHPIISLQIANMNSVQLYRRVAQVKINEALFSCLLLTPQLRLQFIFTKLLSPGNSQFYFRPEIVLYMLKKVSFLLLQNWLSLPAFLPTNIALSIPFAFLMVHFGWQFNGKST